MPRNQGQFERDKRIAQYILANPKETYEEIATDFGVSVSTVRRVARYYSIERRKRAY